MKRGDVVVVAMPGHDTRKPRPAIVVQADAFTAQHASVTLCLVSSKLEEAPLFRITVDPSVENGLRTRSQIGVDKIITAPRDAIGQVVGRLDTDTMGRVDQALRLWLQL